ncbi:MAG: hypothetical protein IJY01_07425, partial [Clostridia bacterium]|nr:hypothetical protein [Clostridia bacterium]
YDRVVYCSTCGEEFSRDIITITKLGHSQETKEENRIEPTCTQDGQYDRVVYCSTCGEEFSRDIITITKLGHSQKTKEENRIEPTCTQDGQCERVVYCSTCGEELSRIQETLYASLYGTHTYNGTVCTVCGIQYKRSENYIYFGEYPQTLKSNNVTITSTKDSRGYYLGSDGYYYAKVVATPNASGYSFSTGTEITDGGVYYFKVEPIRWRILSENNDSAFVFCDSIIANHRYDDSSNNYEESEIRQWLNETFYQKAFTELQQEIIITTTVNNSKTTTGYSENDYACQNTMDKIYLLSYSEAMNTSYGFTNNANYSDKQRIFLTSDYARATGACISTLSNYYGNGFWWLRSPSNSSTDSARGVSASGFISLCDRVPLEHFGVVPALNIRL